MVEIATVEEVAGALTGLSGVVGGLVALFKYFNYKNRRDKIVSVGDALDAVVKSLASNVEVERLAGAIRLRRFFDPEGEFAVGGETPYAADAVSVIAGVLRTQPPGIFQKLLADGLCYAPTLHRADLQRTNLQGAYLGQLAASDGEVSKSLDLSRADFYRADVSGASLKGAFAKQAVFYQARLQNTVLTGADLSNANFFEADLTGAKFTSANLAGADFENAILDRAIFVKARNVPPQVARHLDATGRFPKTKKRLAEADPLGWTQPPRVFVSKPGGVDERYGQTVEAVRGLIERQDFVCETIERSQYPRFSGAAEVYRAMSGCAGVVILGLPQHTIREGIWRSATGEEQRVPEVLQPTPWNHLEAGMAVAQGLPILVVCPRGVAGGIFDSEVSDQLVMRMELHGDVGAAAEHAAFRQWCAAVREHARKA